MSITEILPLLGLRNLSIAKAGLEARRDGQEPAHDSGWAQAVVDLWCRKLGGIRMEEKIMRNQPFDCCFGCVNLSHTGPCSTGSTGAM